MSRIAVITDIGVGGTFLSWSIQWLSGQKNYFSTKYKSNIEITNNPLTKKNSHNFKSNQAQTLSDLSNILNILPNNNIQHVYFHLLLNRGRFSKNKLISNTREGITLASNHVDKIVTINLDKQYYLYDCKLQNRADAYFTLADGKISTANNSDARLDEYIKFFFKESLDVWKKHNLTNIWDKREFIALNFRPHDGVHLSDCHQFDFDHYNIPAHICWARLDEQIENLLTYCGITLDKSRFENWLEVYSEWKKIHYDRIKFCESFDTIIQNILNGNDMDLSEFDLDIIRESAIQHTLIYKHNLNFKTWQLEKFVNTKQLHSLLEPNIHPLSS